MKFGIGFSRNSYIIDPLDCYLSITEAGRYRYCESVTNLQVSIFGKGSSGQWELVVYKTGFQTS